MNRWIGPLAWAWVIIIGVLMFTPGGVQCIACGPGLTKVIGIVSILIGLAGFFGGRGGAAQGR
jgi:hypothetical protein